MEKSRQVINFREKKKVDGEVLAGRVPYTEAKIGIRLKVGAIGSCFKVRERWFRRSRQEKTGKGHISKGGGGGGGKHCIDKRSEGEREAVFCRVRVEDMKGAQFKGF